MSWVYFIKPIGMDGPIKIGNSRWPEGRRETLAVWSPFPLEVVAEIEGGWRVEHQFHALFEHLHQRREWFTAAPELLDVIEQIKAGSFDVRTLPSPKRLEGITAKGTKRPALDPLEHGKFTDRPLLVDGSEWLGKSKAAA